MLGHVNPIELVGGDRDREEEGQDAPVYMYKIGDGNFVFYQGDANAFNRFMVRASQGLSQIRQRGRFREVTAIVVIHAGQCDTRKGSFDSEAPRQPDWILSTLRESAIDAKGALIAESQAVLVDVWLSGIRLDRLEIPIDFKVESGLEIDSFVQRRARGLAESTERK